MELLCKTKNNQEVFIDLKGSHASTHIKTHPGLLVIAKEMVSGMVLKSPVRKEFDMGRTVGTTDLIKLSPKDKVVYAKRLNRDTYAPFVKGYKSVPTSKVTLDVRFARGKYYLYTIFLGGNTPGLPGSDREEKNSRDFWSRHALVWGSQPVQKGTETEECPW